MGTGGASLSLDLMARQKYLRWFSELTTEQMAQVFKEQQKEQKELYEYRGSADSSSAVGAGD